MISEHITFDEATHSDTAVAKGIINNPNPTELGNMVNVAMKCFEPIRAWYGKPIRINSFFRCEALNKAVNGSKTSQHVKGEAIDISAGSKEENLKLFNWAKANLVFDQLIWENDGAWVHISFTKNGNRNEAFSATQIIPK